MTTQNKADQIKAAELAKRMARAAGKASPTLMVQASYMLLQCAAMVGNPDAYIDWSNKIASRSAKTQKVDV